MVELKVPSVGESITEVQIGEWRKREGEPVGRDENVVEIESEKATLEIPAPTQGVISKILKKSGDTAAVGEVIAYIDESATAAKTPQPAAAAPTQAAPTQAAPIQTSKPPQPAKTPPAETRVMPAAARALAEKGLRPEEVTATGPGGRLLKEDAQRAATPAKPAPSEAAPKRVAPAAGGDRSEERVPMSPIRRRIAQRLVEAQHTAALLTTFNEVDMTEIMALRKQHQDLFTQRYGIKLGFMSFFVKGVIEALKQFPAINAEIQGNEIVYRGYYDIGIAIGGGKGLVVPVLRNAEQMGFAEIEQAIADFAKRAQSGQLSPSELQGGTFTISNGGVYGSLLSTPIVNPPQSGVLGMHAIQERPVAQNGQVVIRPMMYVALTYDHRIVDGREAVTFLRRIKDCVEAPVRLLLEV